MKRLPLAPEQKIDFTALNYTLRPLEVRVKDAKQHFKAHFAPHIPLSKLQVEISEAYGWATVTVRTPTGIGYLYPEPLKRIKP